MKKLNTSEFQERLNQIYGENYYIVQSEYINNCTKFRDQLKTDYCKNNDIKLIRLPYYEEYNFSNILDKELKANTEVTN